MYKLEETIVVEGVYDKIKLSGFVESMIITTNGFGIFNSKALQKSVKTLAEKTGIVILTDSDSAGIKIRNFVRQLAKDGRVLNAYVPEIQGKERRKTVGGKAGLLGVEGISEDIIMDALTKSGCKINGVRSEPKSVSRITKTDFYFLGLSGGEKSSELRQKLSLELGLPSKLSANMLLDAVNSLLSKEELIKLLEIIGDI